LPTRKSIFSIFVAVLVCGFILQWWIIGVLIASICSGAIIRWWSKRKIGGITGDVLGGAEQIAEAAILVVLSAQ
jgi:adenosylcobinamide-GDP ribazoletransferase